MHNVTMFGFDKGKLNYIDVYMIMQGRRKIDKWGRGLIFYYSFQTISTFTNIRVQLYATKSLLKKL